MTVQMSELLTGEVQCENNSLNHDSRRLQTDVSFDVQSCFKLLKH